MTTNEIRPLLLITFLVIISLASLSVQAQTRPRRVSPSPKTDAVLLSETRPRQVEAREVTEKSLQHSRTSRATIKQARDFLNRLYQLIDGYIKDSR